MAWKDTRCNVAAGKVNNNILNNINGTTAWSSDDRKFVAIMRD